MIPRYTDDDVRRALESAIAEAGSLRRLAPHMGLSASYLSFVRRGAGPPSQIMARHLGYREDGARWVRDGKKAKR